MSSRIDDGIEAKFQAELAALPEADRARIEAQLSEFNQTFTQGWNRLRSHQKNLLRRMGVKNNLDGSSQFWLQLWAAARHAGISDDEFFKMTPSMLCAVLEHKAAEIARQDQQIDALARNAASSQVPDEPRTLGARLRRHRELKGWTQQTLAEYSRVPVRCITDYECDKAKPGTENLKALAATLDIDIKALLP